MTVSASSPAQICADSWPKTYQATRKHENADKARFPHTLVYLRSRAELCIFASSNAAAKENNAIFQQIGFAVMHALKRLGLGRVPRAQEPRSSRDFQVFAKMSLP